MGLFDSGFLADVVKGVRQAAAVVTLPLTAAAAGIDALTGNHLGIKDEIMSEITTGQTAEHNSNAAFADQQKKEAEARTSAFNDALSGNTLDNASLQELTNLYNSGADSGAIAEKINAARAGKGIYGVRKLNANEKASMAQSPGRSQLSSLGSRSILGGGNF